MGNNLRARTSNEILALWAMAEINALRTDQERQPCTAWIIRSIKHPDEVRALRAVYGPGFYLLGLFVPEDHRRWCLQQKQLLLPEIDALIERDQAEDFGHGQHMRGAFELADFFVRHAGDTRDTCAAVDRFLRLVFGKAVETPTPDENAMFLAYASSARSGDLSRQVGAVVWKDRIGLVATGCNDVPAAGGGLYVAGPADQRDHVRGLDANEQQKTAIALEVARRVTSKLTERGVIPPDGVVEDACKDTRLSDLTEFGRAVHAEMDALLTCARTGVSTLGATLYCTTFPCHNCAKHLVAAGFSRVVYVEPYPKSLAKELHGDAIDCLDGRTSATGGKVAFEPFLGVGPRRFLDLFSMRIGDGFPLKRKLSGTAASWQKDTADVRVPMLPTSYLDRENQAAHLVRSLLNPPENQP